MTVLFFLSTLAFASDNADQPQPVRQGVRAQVSDVVRCYGKRARRSPLAGQISVTGAVAESHLDEVEVIANTVGSKSLGRCVRRRMERWRFNPDYTGPLAWTFTFGEASTDP